MSGKLKTVYKVHCIMLSDCIKETASATCQIEHGSFSYIREYSSTVYVGMSWKKWPKVCEQGREVNVGPKIKQTTSM